MGSRMYLTAQKGFYIYFAVLLLLVPLRWIVAAVVSAGVHELFHIAAIRIMGVTVHSLRIGINGTRIQTGPMTQRQELFCALAGPAGGLCLLPLARWMPAVCLCGFIQSLYNLLPVYPADGGRAVRCAAGLLLPQKRAEKVCFVIERLVLTAILLAGLYGTFHMRLGLFPLAVAFLILWGSKKRNNSCKESDCGVQ